MKDTRFIHPDWHNPRINQSNESQVTIYEHKFSSGGIDMLLQYVDEKYAKLMLKTHGGTITRIDI